MLVQESELPHLSSLLNNDLPHALCENFRELSKVAAIGLEVERIAVNSHMYTRMHL
jgi:hypothetical protein